MTYNTSAEKTAFSRNSYIALKALEKMAKGRCWEGYEPVPGKPAYSNDSCRPVGSKKKKKTEKEAFVAWGGSELGLHPKGKGVGGSLGYTNLLGMVPIPTGHLDIGGPQHGFQLGVAADPGSDIGISPLIGARFNHPRKSGLTRQFPRGLIEVIYDKLRGRTKEDAIRANYPELFEEADDEDSYVPPDSDDSDEYLKKIQQAVKGDDRFEVVENDSEKAASNCGSYTTSKLKKKKKRLAMKSASSCGSHAASKPKKKKKKLVTKAAQQAALAIAEKVANYRAVVAVKDRESRIKQAKCVLNVYRINQELEKYDLHRLQKSAAVGAHKAERLKAAALIRQRELEKQEFLEKFASVAPLSPALRYLESAIQGATGYVPPAVGGGGLKGRVMPGVKGRGATGYVPPAVGGGGLKGRVPGVKRLLST